ncbi:LOB domain-containing protein 24-like [Ananas comosus]|uniref:LOB domain-containing protein 24-like n=1 Tax=Ananas comosus TaxID=4615 RepID=A0A6P5EQ21_ANACO|nr:LOB domain-containing protein 24-like [Ananas comosus]
MSTSSHNSNNTSPSPIINESNQRRCAACKYLRKRCSRDCVLSPYFPASLPHRFACVHKIFGASNVARTLQQLPVHQRAQAAEAMSAEAYWRVQDPVYGSVGVINLLQQHIYMNQRELARTRAHIAIHSPTRGPCSPWAGLWTSPI